MTELVITNGWIITPSGLIHGALGIDDGIITYVGSDSNMPKSKRIINARDNYVCPGLIRSSCTHGYRLGVI